MKNIQRHGFAILLTGLSGSGKSTIANFLVKEINKDRSVTLLDGDNVRTHLSSELGYSKEHRNLNIQRLGFVASEVVKHGGVSICATIAPYAKARENMRKMIKKYGGFIEVYISTPLSECEERDVKGLYKKARSGTIKNFTGIDDPYETPTKPDLEIDTTDSSIEASAHQIIRFLSKKYT